MLLYKKRSREKTRDIKKQYINKLKNCPCMDCGIIYPPYVMEFDHVRGKKKDGIANMVSKTYSLDMVIKEIEKCEIVCANCHRKRTFLRKQWTSGNRGGITNSFLKKGGGA